MNGRICVYIAICFVAIFAAAICIAGDGDRPAGKTVTVTVQNTDAPRSMPVTAARPSDARFKIVQVYVALCDNRYQGIEKVPASLGDGQKPSTNLYWGAMYGVKTFFRKSYNWKVWPYFNAANKKRGILDVAIFESQGLGPKVYVVAFAYAGNRMRDTLRDFFAAAAGEKKAIIETHVNGKKFQLPIEGFADLVCFVGHNGLMDVKPGTLGSFRPAAVHPGNAVVLACKSQVNFSPILEKLNCNPLITTTTFMAPEAYTLDAIVREWAFGGTAEMIRREAAKVYAKYQNCHVSAAMQIF
ncbi:MAG TPA: hypothetical protein PLK08_04175, partial [Phycisphaerae bacterium]|nr:hypothetical protein [Phycisphaerae bacterium]